MELNVMIKYKNGHFIATPPGQGMSAYRGVRSADLNYKLFNCYYEEARALEIPDDQIVDHVVTEIMNREDIEHWLSSEEVEQYVERARKNLWRRIERYKQKLYWLNPNYYVTFTYSDAKETRESFEKRLKMTLSNFHNRHGWLAIVVPEDGHEKGRLHFHCFINIPKGGMVGELFLNAKYSSKRLRREYFTDNTYFAARFGQSDWHPITRDDLLHGGLETYLTKYLTKSGNKIFYSRGIPSEIYAVIDTETDVVVSIREGLVWRYLLFDSFMDLELLLDLEDVPMIDDVPGFSIDRYLTYTDKRKLVWSDEKAIA